MTTTTTANVPAESPAFWAGFYDLLDQAAAKCRRIMAEVEERKTADRVDILADETRPAADQTAQATRHGDYAPTVAAKQKGRWAMENKKPTGATAGLGDRPGAAVFQRYNTTLPRAYQDLLTQADRFMARALATGDQAGAMTHRAIFDALIPLAVKYAQAKL
jgi:hypothetical protein